MAAVSASARRRSAAGAASLGEGEGEGLLGDLEKGGSPALAVGVHGGPALMFGARGQRLARLLRLGLLLLAGLAALDAAYLTVAWLRIADPCALAASTKAELAASARSDRALPRVVHQQWIDEDVPAKFRAYHARWASLFPAPEFRHVLWTDASGRQLIADDFAWFLPAYDGFKLNIQRADALRCFVLYKYGGIFADLDYEPFVNFYEELAHDRANIIESPYKVNEAVQNSLMASPARDPFWNFTFQVMFERKDSHKVLSSTGPSMVDEAIRRAPAEASVHVLPCENFHRIPLGNAGMQSPWLSRYVRNFLAYSPLVKQCGSWQDKTCQFGLHHNAVSYMNNMGSGTFDFLFNF